MLKLHTRHGLVAFLFIAAICPAQQLPDVSPFDGYTAGQSQQGGPAGSSVLSGLEIINPSNGTLTLHIPLITVQGRGSVSVPLSVNLTPPMWDVTASTYTYNCNPGGCQIGWNYTMTASSWLSPANFGAGQFAFRSSGDYCLAVSTTSTRWNSVVTRGTFTAPDGTETEFVDQQTNGTPEPGNLGYNRGAVFLADNGSMAKFTASAAVSDSTSCLSGIVASPSGTLVWGDGTKYTIANGTVTQIEDDNGNLTSFGSTVTDSLGRTYQIASGSGNGPGSLMARQTQTIASSGTLPSSGTNYNPPQYNQKTTINYYDSNGGALLESQSITYYQPSNCQTNCSTVQTVTTTMPKSSTSEVSQVTYGYDQYNNVVSESDTDWGSGSPGAVLRKTATTYNTASNYIAANMLSLPTEVKVQDGSGNTYTDTQYAYDGTTTQNDPNIPYHDNTNFGTGQNTRGNLTSVKQWLNGTSPTWLATTLSYDMAGNLLSVEDANSHTTSFSYTDNYLDGANRYSYGFVTATTNVLGQSAHAQYDYYIGQPSTVADLNGVQTTFSYNDPLDRMTQIVQAAGLTGFQTQTNYSYTGLSETDVYQDQTSFGDRALHSRTLLDGFGRLAETDTFEASNQYVAATQSYDAMGRLSATTNPSRYTSGTGDGLNYATTYSYDGLSRQTAVTTADNSVSTTTYSPPYTTVTDPAGHARVLQYDALNRLTAVWEDPNGNNYQTTYAYGPDSTLKTVTQGAQTRSFSYDSLGRLTKSVQPESGTTSYGYDNVGNVTSRVDGNNITDLYTYDPLNRVTQIAYYDNKTYTRNFTYDEPNRGYSYGHLTTVNNSTAINEAVSISPLGQVTASMEQTDNGTYDFSYYYNLAGALIQENYPSGRVITTGYDSANRSYSATGSYGGVGTTYVSEVSYWPQNTPGNIGFGNNVHHDFHYNNRMQVDEIWDTVGDNPNYFMSFLSYTYGSAGNNNNGNISGINELFGNKVPWSSMTQFNQSFTYDNLNRVSTAGDSGGWSRSFQYDQYGNPWVPSASGIGYGVSTPMWNVYNSANNRVNGSPYTGTGAVTALPPGYSFSYDGENRVTSETNSNGPSATYYYDGLGERVVKVVGSTTTVYVYDAFGNLAEEYSPYNVWSKDYIFLNGEAAAIENASANPCGTCYLSRDHLGTVRMVTDPTTSIITRHDYLPFGDEIQAGWAGRSSQFGAGADNVNQKFTGQYRDPETLNDDFPARYYTAPLMRFLTPDPAGPAAVDISDPQTWNQYAYVRNNPLALVDPSGMDTNYAGLQQGVCPASKANCPMPGNPVAGTPTVDNEFNAAEIRYVQETVIPGFSGTPPHVTSAPLSGGIVSATIIYGNLTKLLSANMVSTSNWDVSIGDIGQQVFANQQLWRNTAGVGNALGAATAAVWALPVLVPGATGAAAKGIGIWAGLGAGDGVVLGTYASGYAAGAKALGANAFNLPDWLYNPLFNLGEAWTANGAFLMTSILRAQQFWLSLDPELAPNGGTYWMELQYLQQRGINPNTLPIILPQYLH